LNWDYPPYVTVAERKEKAQKTLKRLQKKQPDLEPILIEGKGLAKTWWGKAWHTNLKNYADFSNRIGRGRSYVKNGFVLDLKITRGKIDALVLGSESMPYSIQIKIAALPKKKREAIKKKSKDKIDSLQELLEGKFPRDLEQIFTAKGAGLFPSPKEIKMDCSCPDWAIMCKHVAATLYGVGARLDQDPELFFSLRGIDVGDLIDFAVKKRKKELLGSVSGKKKSSRVIKDSEAELSSLFNIDFSESNTPAARAKPKKKASKKKKTAKKKAAKKISKKPVMKKFSAKKAVRRKVNTKVKKSL